MLKHWLQAKQLKQKQERETDAYSQLLTQRDPYYESFMITDTPREQKVESEQCLEPGQ